MCVIELCWIRKYNFHITAFLAYLMRHEFCRHLVTQARLMTRTRLRTSCGNIPAMKHGELYIIEYSATANSDVKLASRMTPILCLCEKVTGYRLL